MTLTARNTIYEWGGRSFVLTVGCGFVCTLLVICGTISEQVFQYIIIGTVGAFITGNAWEGVRAKDEASKG